MVLILPTNKATVTSNKHLLTKVNIDLSSTYIANGKAEDVEAECKRLDNLIEEAGELITTSRYWSQWPYWL